MLVRRGSDHGQDVIGVPNEFGPRAFPETGLDGLGHFQLRAYRVRNTNDVMHDDQQVDELGGYQNTNALEPVVIYSTDKPPFGKDGKLRDNVPIRIHDQCLTSEVFRSQRYVVFCD